MKSTMVRESKPLHELVTQEAVQSKLRDWMMKRMVKKKEV